MAATEISVHGRRLQLGPGYLKVDGRRIPGIDIGNKTFYVSSVTGVDGRDGLTPSTALATITAALALCTANQGDTIILLPTHAETITAAGGITIATAGVSIVGVGVRGQRAILTYTTANTATLLNSAAGTYLENIVFKGNFLSIAGAIDNQGADLTIENCECRDIDATHGFLNFIKATGAANTGDGLKVTNSRRYGLSTTGGAFVNITDNLDRLILQDNFDVSVGTSSTFLTSAGSKIITNADVGRNQAQTAATSGNLFISNGGATNTGFLYDNYNGNLDVTGAQTFGAATGIQFFNNQSTSTSTEAGALAQAADTPLS